MLFDNKFENELSWGYDLPYKCVTFSFLRAKMYNNFNGQNLRRNDMSYEFLDRNNPRQHDMKNFRSRGFVNNRFTRNNSQRGGYTSRGTLNLFPHSSDTSISLDCTNLENSYTYSYSNIKHDASNQTENVVANSRIYRYPNSTSNANDPVNQSPDISSSTSPKKELDPNNELNPNNKTQSDIDQNISFIEPITSSLHNAEKNDRSLSKSETFQSTQLDINSSENFVSNMLQ